MVGQRMWRAIEIGQYEIRGLKIIDCSFADRPLSPDGDNTGHLVDQCRSVKQRCDRYSVDLAVGFEGCTIRNQDADVFAAQTLGFKFPAQLTAKFVGAH